MGPVLALPAVLDIQAAEALRVQLLDARGGSLALDGSSVERLGGLCLQVLLSARQTWAADGHSLVVSPVSGAFTDQWNAFGAPAWAAGQPGDPA
ncbi:STAS domain-containing protein [Brevundimonas sp.]|uniref:STAS domain-containing protein n=1 Tax=Brevundimonas sp. TaxID=1871086 RepID=UPI00273792A6|nr:STAS domain-containing protein [Brevundimonas sp.]MDP3801776.1 STAS domain-containing protein [Brevundimonas sp.]